VPEELEDIKDSKTFRPVSCGLLVGLFMLVLHCSMCRAEPPMTAPAASQPGGTGAVEFTVVARQTCEGLGACQGASLHDGFVYLYGDLYQKDHQSGPGVIR
jgi:hypothetical protein